MNSLNKHRHEKDVLGGQFRTSGPALESPNTSMAHKCTFMRRRAAEEPQAHSAAPPFPPHSFLTEQVAAGDAPFGDGDFHGADGGRENVGLLQDLGEERAVQGTEGRGVVLLRPLVQLQDGELIPAGLGIPVLVLKGERGAQFGAAIVNIFLFTVC